MLYSILHKLIMDNKCNERQCAHYIDSKHLHLYKNKFLYTIVIATALCVSCFLYLSCSFKDSCDRIVGANSASMRKIDSMLRPAKMSKDSCYYVNEQLAATIKNNMAENRSLLEMQVSRIQSDFSLLSLWAGILMIVFLVFSIYSMFKTDELIKQSRESLKRIEESAKQTNVVIETIRHKTEEEIEKVTQKANEEANKISTESLQTLEDVKKEIFNMRDEFSNMVKERSDTFENMYNEMVVKVQQASNVNAGAIGGLAELLKFYMSQSQTK